MSGFGGFSGLLIHTAVVYRRQQVGGGYKTDRFGQPSRDEAEDHLLACRVTRAHGGEMFTDRTHDVVEAKHELFLDKGADISEQDVVTVLDAPLSAVEAAKEADEEGYISGFDAVCERAEVLLAQRVDDGVSEHHREALLSTQRESGPAR